MTPAHTDSPLRRSEAGIFRDGATNGPNVTINDDDEERREARRRTLQHTNASESGASFEENETLKKCLEIYNGNKLSRDNAWSLSLIDTLSTLLDRHHKSLNNFKVAGSSLEASSKVYSLRVDSIHTDVLRMSAGLSARKFNEQQARGGDDDDDDSAGVNGDPNSTQTINTDGADNGSKEGAAAGATASAKRPKRQRKAVSTITKNKETLNARLDTVPLQDPVFGKLNSIVGSINSSNRLMNNILLTTESELRLRTNFAFWDSSVLPECDFTEEVVCDESEMEMAPCDGLFNLKNYEDLQLRPIHAGYIISDTPEIITDEAEKRHESLDSNESGGGGGGGDGFNDNFCRSAELSMAFDINAECEPLPPPGTEMVAPVLDVDYADLEELTSEERIAINNCRGLRKAPVLIEDLRPVDANSKLEYSYRPLDKISQFWAGPSHWKFKKSRMRGSTMHSQQVLSGTERQNGRTNPRGKRAAALLAKQRAKQLNFGEYHDDLFLKLDDKFKTRKANVHKKWDQRKLKLPTDLQIDPMIFFKYTYAPQLSAAIQPDLQTSATAPGNFDTDDEGAMDSFTEPFGGDVGNAEAGEVNFMHVSTMGDNGTEMNAADAMEFSDIPAADDVNACNNTVLEIGTNFEGAPSQVTRIIVPFAKRAKVIDMKNLKRCCSQLLAKHLKRQIHEEHLPSHPLVQNETYAPGVANFGEIYNELPSLLTQSMAEALSPSVAFYSVLHLANDLNLRLIPQEDLEDFKLRQVIL